MVLGTASHVGKSLIAAALCRIFADRGLLVRPFKAQNMSLNSAATPDRGEIGRAQALQAEAASVDMNPVLLKPMSDQRSQVVVLGRPAGDSDARRYHTERVNALFPIVVAAYERLARGADLIVLEGAGSPAEINLRDGDIVNLRMAAAAGAACLLVADIDRGGMFAALAGTLLQLEPHERARIRAFIVNKFRGDVTLLAPGIDDIVQRLGIPCAGVIPFVHNLELDEEHRRSARMPLVGICAGMQMLGETVADPHAVEGGGTRATIGLLALTTRLAHEKTTRAVRARYEPAQLFGQPAAKLAFDGYEIHQGVTERGPGLAPAAVHAFGEDGAASADGMIVGTYVHGFFGNDAFRNSLLGAARSAAGLAPRNAGVAWQHEREDRLAAWSTHVKAHLDVELIARLLGR